MRRVCVLLGVTIAALILLGTVGEARAQAVAQVVSVDVKGDLDGYLAVVKDLQAVVKRVTPNAAIRIWQATLAGDGTGNVFVVIEHPSLEDYAKNTGKLQADAEWPKLIERFPKTGREILSNSLISEVTP
jgi:hypothetical protein